MFKKILWLNYLKTSEIESLRKFYQMTRLNWML